MISAAHSFSYVDCDIPEDLTLDVYRQRKVTAARASRSGRIHRLRRAVRGAHLAPAPALRLA